MTHEIKITINPQPPLDAENVYSNECKADGGPSWWWFKDEGRKIYPRPGVDAIQCPYEVGDTIDNCRVSNIKVELNDNIWVWVLELVEEE